MADLKKRNDLYVIVSSPFVRYGNPKLQPAKPIAKWQIRLCARRRMNCKITKSVKVIINVQSSYTRGITPKRVTSGGTYL